MRVVVSRPDTMSGTPCFRDTRVPVATLFEYLKAGDTIEEFLVQFPTVSREAVVTVLREASRHLEQAAEQQAA